MARLMLVFCLGLLVWCELGVWGCRKEEKPTIIEGKVVDAKTGTGLDSVEIRYATHPRTDEDFHQVVDRLILTNGEGIFSIELKPGESILSVLDLEKVGYNPLVMSLKSLKNGEINEVSFNMWVIDSWLKLLLLNNLPQEDSIYISVNNNTVHPEIFAGGIKNNPIVLGFGESQIWYFPFSSDTYTTITRGNTLANYQQNPIIDSVFMPVLDTVESIISF